MRLMQAALNAQTQAVDEWVAEMNSKEFQERLRDLPARYQEQARPPSNDRPGL